LDKNVRVMNFDNGQVARTLPTPTPVTATAYTGAAAAALTAAGTATGQIIIWGAVDAKPIFQVQAHAGEVTGLAFSPQGNELLSVGADGTAKVWSLPVVAPRVLSHPADVRSAIVTGDGKRVMTAGADNVVRLFSLANNQVEKQFAGHTKPA